MPSTRRRRGAGSATLASSAALATALATSLAATACGGPHGRAAGPTTTLLQADRWSPPPVSGPPSPARFCAVLTALYQHEAEASQATTKVKEQILRDYEATVPEALAVAPADIEPAARTYMTAVGRILGALAAAGLVYKKTRPGTLTPLLLDPQIKAAGNQVLDYARSQCHYVIGAPVQQSS